MPGELIFWGHRISGYVFGHVFAMTSEGEAELELGPGSHPTYSPDGDEIAYFTETTSFRHLHIANTDLSDSMTLVTVTGRSRLGAPASWTPDGESLAVAWLEGANDSMDIALIDRTGSVTVLTGSLAPSLTDPDWHPAGESLAVTISGSLLGILSPDGTTLDTIPGDDPGLDEQDPAWSPTGDRIAYRAGTDASGAGTIYVMDADGSGRTMVVEHAIGKPAWSPDGTRLAVALGDHPDYGSGIFILSLEGTTVTRLTEESDQGVDWWHPPE